MSHTEIVTIDPEIMSGAPVFCGTRVPIQNLLDYLKAGHWFRSMGSWYCLLRLNYAA